MTNPGTHLRRSRNLVLMASAEHGAKSVGYDPAHRTRRVVTIKVHWLCKSLYIADSSLSARIQHKNIEPDMGLNSARASR